MKAFTVDYVWDDGTTINIGLIAPNQAKALVMAFDDMPEGAKLSSLQELRS